MQRMHTTKRMQIEIEIEIEIKIKMEIEMEIKMEMEENKRAHLAELGAAELAPARELRVAAAEMLLHVAGVAAAHAALGTGLLRPRPLGHGRQLHALQTESGDENYKCGEE